MKNQKRSLADFAKQLAEKMDGTIEGGFTIIGNINNALIVGGLPEPNTNCSGGNCVAGCSQNNVAGCGGSVNNVPGCGAPKNGVPGCGGQ